MASLPDTSKPSSPPTISSIFSATQLEYDRDLRGVTSPFRREIKPAGPKVDTRGAVSQSNDNAGVISKPNNTFKINNYQWYPSDILRRFVDDYYNNIDIDFAKNETPAKGGFLSGVVAAAQNEINSVTSGLIDSVNQISDAATNIKNLINGTSTEPTAPTLRNNFDKFIGSFPYAKIYEFKPQDSLGATVAGLATAFKMIDNIVDGGGGFANTINDIITGLQSFILATFKIDIKNPAQLADPNFRIYGLPNGLYRNMISGYYTGYYEIPLLENTDFLNSRGSDGWEAQGFVDRFFGGAGSMVKGFMTDNVGSGLDIATKPKWQVQGGGEPFKDITIKVTLFNDNLKAAYNNMAFIHSFVGGNLWYQDTLIQKCSSLYDVELPGRCRYYFCSCNVEVNFLGKVRVVSLAKNKSDIIKNLSVFTKAKSQSDIILDYNTLNKMNPYVLNNIPDAYDMTFTFHPLLPNNYNTYYSYIIGSDDDAVKGVGSQIDNLWQNLASTVSAAVTTGNATRNATAAKQTTTVVV